MADAPRSRAHLIRDAQDYLRSEGVGLPGEPADYEWPESHQLIVDLLALLTLPDPAPAKQRHCRLCEKPQPCPEHGRTPVCDADFDELSRDLARSPRGVVSAFGPIPVPTAPADGWEDVTPFQAIVYESSEHGTSARQILAYNAFAVDRARAADQQKHQQELDRWKFMASGFEADANKNMAALTEARAKLAALTDALKHFGMHAARCPWAGEYWKDGDEAHCSCPIGAALLPPPSPPTGE